MKEETKEDIAQAIAYLIVMILFVGMIGLGIWLGTKIVLFAWTGHF